ncbi:MAG: hypothetical protein GY950_34815 [bacterium]|nr:hypothetical protein [bacterium]
MSDQLKKTSFDPFVNEKFEVVTDAGGIEVELTDVSEHNKENLESFSVLFKGPKDKFFNQKIYKVKHPKMGEIELFLVPVVHEKQDAIYYESAFSRLIEKK